jgi:hypothetical protein
MEGLWAMTLIEKQGLNWGYQFYKMHGQVIQAKEKAKEDLACRTTTL